MVCMVVMVIARISKSLCVSSFSGSGLMMIVKNFVPLGASSMNWYASSRCHGAVTGKQRAHDALVVLVWTVLDVADGVFGFGIAHFAPFACMWVSSRHPYATPGHPTAPLGGQTETEYLAVTHLGGRSAISGHLGSNYDSGRNHPR